MTSCAPTSITSAPTTPPSAVVEKLIIDIVVSDLITLSSNRCTPLVNTSCSRSSAWYPFTTRTPESDSVSRPLTSALIFERSRKIGRKTLNAFRSPTMLTSKSAAASPVITGLMRSSM